MVVLCGVLVAGWFALGAVALGSGSCVIHPIAEFASPDSTFRVAVFDRGCGATTGFGTHAALLDQLEPLSTEVADLFVADTDHGVAPPARWGGPELQVRWLDTRTVELSHHDLARVFRADTLVRGVTIRYRRTREEPTSSAPNP